MRIEIPMKLPSLNEYITECRRNRYAGATMKKNIEEKLALFIGRLPEYKRPVTINFIWVEQNKKRDLDNVAFAKKFILDAMVKTGRIPNDNGKYVKGFTDKFEYQEETKVIIEVNDVEQ